MPAKKPGPKPLTLSLYPLPPMRRCPRSWRWTRGEGEGEREEVEGHKAVDKMWVLTAVDALSGSGGSSARSAAPYSLFIDEQESTA